MMENELITKALEIYSDLDEGEIVDVDVVAKMIFDLVERLEAADKVVDIAESSLRIGETKSLLAKTIKEYKELKDD